MQDRFKFRFFDKDKKIMIKPPDEMSDSEWRRCCNIYGYDEWYFSIELALTKVLDYFDNTSFEIMQCTGLKDKNGKLIFEGDVIKIPDDYDTYGMFACEKREVYFNEGGFRLKPKWDKNSRGNWLEDTKDFEIIGNIYENPELLSEVE